MSMVAERGDERVGVIGHRLDGVGHADSSVVEGDDAVVLCDRFNEGGVPVVQCGGEVDEEDNGNARSAAQFAISESDAAAGGGGACRYDVMVPW
jgi:hypothetical protein